jgi:hypothetical protein
MLSEHGHAMTLAANWLPTSYLRLTAELLHVNSFRVQRTVEGQSPRLIETQLQLNLRVYY